MKSSIFTVPNPPVLGTEARTLGGLKLPHPLLANMFLNLLASWRPSVLAT